MADRLLARRRWRRATVVVVVLGLCVAGRIAWHAWREEYKDYQRWPSADIVGHPERTGIAGLQEIAFAARGEPTVAAWYAPSHNRAAIVLLHGTESDRSFLLPEIRFLSAAGFGVLALDAPGQGASAGKTQWGVPERHAISAAVDWLQLRSEVQHDRIGAFGLSMGAYVTLQAAVLDARIAAVALVSPPHDVVEFNWVATRRWGWLSQIPTYLALRAGGTPTDMRPKDIAGSLAPRPLLIIHGRNDPLVASWMSEQIAANARAPKEYHEIEGAGHADFARVAFDAYRSIVTGFFQRALLAPSDTP